MWRLKIIAKIILSRLPIRQSFWRKIGIFRNGGMNQVDYSKKIFFSHLEGLKKINDVDEPVIMEIGPGDGIASVIFSKIYNSPKVFLIDVGNFADQKISVYKDIISSLESELFKEEKFKNFNTIEELLKAFNGTYLVNGLDSIKSIESNSIDYLFSHSVLEHISLFELDSYIKEMYRVVKPNGLISHNTNYKDHLGESLNNLRFSEKIWESKFFVNSGFYTNRVPAVEMHKKFTKSGFNMVWEKFGTWPKLPIDRKYIHKDFHKYTNEELNIPTSAFVARK